MKSKSRKFVVVFAPELKNVGHCPEAESFKRDDTDNSGPEPKPVFPDRKTPAFYGVIAVAMLMGLSLDFAGLDAVKMLFLSAVLNGVLAPPLVVLVGMLTSDPGVMGERVNPALLRSLGWVCAVAMAAAAVAMIVL